MQGEDFQWHCSDSLTSHRFLHHSRYSMVLTHYFLGCIHWFLLWCYFFWLTKNHYSFLSLQANRRSSSYFLYFNCQAPDSGLTFSNPQLRTTPRTKIPCWYMCGQEDSSPLLQQQNTWYCQEKNLYLCQWSRQMSKLQCGYKALSYMSHSLLMWPYWIC